MSFWEYDIGDEIRINDTIDGKPTGRISTYKVVDRYIKRPTLGFAWKSTILDRYYVLYVNDGNLYNKNEYDVKELVKKFNGTVIRKHAKDDKRGELYKRMFDCLLWEYAHKPDCYYCPFGQFCPQWKTGVEPDAIKCMSYIGAKVKQMCEEEMKRE